MLIGISDNASYNEDHLANRDAIDYLSIKASNDETNEHSTVDLNPTKSCTQVCGSTQLHCHARH